MKAIDTKSWAEFKIEDLFDVTTTKSIDKNKVTLNADGPNDFVGRSITNWSIQGRLDNLDYDPNPSNVFSLIQIGQTQVFWRERPWYASQNIFMLKPKHETIKDNYLFLQTSLNKSLMKYQTSYTSYPTKKTLKELKIQLPVDQTGHPDWNYMEAFMEQINQQAQARLNEHKEGKLEYTPVDTESWQEFKIGDLFDVNQVNRLTFPGKSYVKDSEIISKDGTTPYIAAISTKNGITGYSAYPANNKGDCITLSTTADSSATVFYQQNPFIGRQQMAGLYKKDKTPMGLNLGLFFVSSIKKVLNNYNYTNKLTIPALKQSYISLPIQQVLDPDKTYHPEGYIPDWDYMEAFMKQINQQAQAKLDTLEKGNI